MTTQRLTFTLDSNHEYMFVKNGSLYEAYGTLKGTRIRHRLDLSNDEPDSEQLTDEEIKNIENKYLR